jgi:MtN3 and saliva related transmembrane protein
VKKMVLELIGYLGGFLIAVALLPQIIKTFKTKSAKDISILWTSVLLIGLFLYAVYAAKNTILPLLVFATVEFIMTTILVFLKIKYDQTKMKKVKK